MTSRGQLQIAIVDAAACVQKYDWGDVVGGTKVYACHAGQLDVLASRAKYTAAFAGAQGGKTALVPLWLMKVIARNGGGGRYLVVSPTVPMRRNSQIVDHFERAYADTPLAGSYLKGDAEYRWQNGVILFRTADNPVSLDGGVYDGVVVDEAAKITLDAWQRIKVRASAKDAPVLMVSTPDVASCIHDEVFKQTKPRGDGLRVSDDGQYLMRTWSSIQRPGYNLKAYEDARRTMSPAMFDRMYRGVFTRFEGLVYECFADPKDAAFPVIPTPSPLRLPSPAICTVGGTDFGFTTDPAVTLIGAHCEDGVLYVVDEVYKRGLNNDELAAEIIRLKRPWEVAGHYKLAEALGGSTTTTFYCDTEDPKAIATLRNYGIAARPKKVRDILPSVSVVNAMFKAGRLVIFDRCTNLIDELKKWQWEQGRDGEYRDTPVDKDNHAADALRYMVASHMQGKQITPVELDRVATPEEAEQHEREALLRLGIDADARRKQAAKAEELKWRQWQHHLLTCDDD